MSIVTRQPHKLKVGRYVLDPKDNAVCKILEIARAKPEPFRFTVLGVFDEKKRTIEIRSSGEMQTVYIEREKAYVVDISETKLHLLDYEDMELETEIDLPTDPKQREEILRLWESDDNLVISLIRFEDLRKIVKIEAEE